MLADLTLIIFYPNLVFGLLNHSAVLAAEVWKAKASDLETLTKGANVELNGWLKADSYTDKDGQTRNRVTLEVSDFKVFQKVPKEGGE